jgi:signal transduction histidine kinase
VPSLVLAAAVREAERARQRLHFLADASVQLAGSLDYPATLRCAVRLPVPVLADCCIVITSSNAEGAAETVVGYPSSQPPPQEPWCRYPLVARGQTLGTYQLYWTQPDRYLQEADLALAADLVRRTALALDNARLYAQQGEHVSRLHQLHGQLEAFEREHVLEDERHRIARDLHDRVEQTFFGIGLTARAELDHVGHRAESLRASLATMLAFAERGAEQLREAIFALSRAEVRDRELVPSLWQLVRDFQKQACLEADLVVSGHERRVSPETAELLYAVAREALANVERHASASAVVLSLCFEPQTALLSVQDDGAGVSPLVLRTLADSATHFGLRSLRERVSLQGGTFIAQPGEDGGFVVRALVPLQDLH